MSKIQGKAEVDFSFPCDSRFDGMTTGQKRNYMQKAIARVLRLGNLKISKVNIKLK